MATPPWLGVFSHNIGASVKGPAPNVRGWPDRKYNTRSTASGAFNFVSAIFQLEMYTISNGIRTGMEPVTVVM